MTTMQPLDNAQYDSIADFLQAINHPMCRNPKNQAQRDCYAHTDNRDGWYGAGCATGDDVQRKMREGWPEGRSRMDELRDKISMPDLVPVDRRRRMVRTDMGDSLDIHSVYAGQLDTAWSVARRRNTAGPQRIDLCANMICTGGEYPDVLFWRGAAAAVLVDLLESAGYMVRLVVCFGGKIPNGNEKSSCRIVVKDHDKPFDIASVSTIIMPGFFRALGHAWIVGHCKTNITASWGGIYVEQGKLEDREILVSHGVRDHGTALAFVNDTIAKINSTQGEIAA